MKKSLKVIASAAMALSMFSSVAMADEAATTSTSTTAAVKTSKDFKDLAGQDAALLAKIDALLKAGVFEGVSDDTFGISQNMTRAQVAKVLTLIYNVKVDTSVKTSSFTDVKADDSANGWAIPYIEAAKKAGLIDGMTDTTFAPGDNVTLGQFATLLVKGLGKKVDVTGNPWYSDAVSQAVSLGLLPAGTDGSKFATRADLVGGAFNGQQAYNEQNKPAQVSVASAKATGVQTVTVNFDRDVDTSKATLTLKKGTIAINTTAKFSDDKKSATLTLTDTKLSAGDYTVTLGGLDASAIKTATATFTAQDEAVQKIEFVTSSDTIAYSNNVVVKIKATNQYGELASASAGNYSFYGDVTKLTRDNNGYLLATVDSVTNKTQGVSIATVTIVNNDSHVSATKNFTVGTTPILTKLELGTPSYSNGTAISGTSDNAKFALNVYDQYGSLIPYDVLTSNSNWNNPTVIWNDYVQDSAAKATVEDDGNNMPEMKITLSENVDKSGDYSFTVIDQAATASGKVTINSAKVANKVKFGDMTDVIAAGDADAYIPVIAYDASGNQLSTDDLVSDTNVARLKFSASGATSYKFETSGEHKGTLHLSGITGTKNSAVAVTAIIATANVSSSDSKTYTVQAARVPDHFKEVTAPATYAVAGGYSPFEYDVYDQYGAKLKTTQQVDSSGNISSTGSTYTVSVTATTYASGSTTPTTVTPGSTTLSGAGAIVTTDNDDTNGTSTAKFGSSATTYTGDISGFNSTFRFYTYDGSQGSKVNFVARILKTTSGVTTEIAKVDKTVTVLAKNTDMTYSLNSVPNLFNTIDSGVTVSGNTYYDGSLASYTTNSTNETDPTQSKLAREVTVSAISSGDKVAVPKKIVSITSANTSVARTAVTAAGKAYVIGNKAGTTQIAVTFVQADGTSKTLSTNVTVKNDALSVAGLSWDDNGYNNALKFNAFQKLNVTDNYGVTYEDTDAAQYNYLLGVTFAVTNISGGTVTVDQYGNVTATPDSSNTSGIVTFDLTATSASGKSATTAIAAKAGNTNYTAQ
ncbi:S-layer homology domain-containing protein [Gordoniibacillus kamchatkensis]|uniref:S-layer homology domain-containing protein n=1 Tax=Gordoniibacillus kamchatkensis TaxID=1590651 RepID=UPI000698F39F|nr:S-layer homology domain-containing protein [Paenibacillus sp. VKM B-2647]